MSFGWYYPPGAVTSRGPEVVPQSCKNGHEWEAEMFWELGAWYYCDEDQEARCPKCGEEAREVD